MPSAPRDEGGGRGERRERGRRRGTGGQGERRKGKEGGRGRGGERGKKGEREGERESLVTSLKGGAAVPLPYHTLSQYRTSHSTRVGG
eukprot:3675890-Rhodomonas_salina.1